MEIKGMDNQDVLIDLESGNNVVISKHNNGIDGGSRVGHARTALNGACIGLTGADGCSKDDSNQHMSCGSTLSLEVVAKNGEDRKSEGEEKVGLLDNLGGEKAKKKRFKKPPRPPKPPTPSPLDAADQKLINELTELAMLKRARIERMKALKKMKNSKPASPSSSLCAMLITIVFCLVILWQGISSRHGTSITFRGSPESSVGARGRLISIQFYKKNGPSISPRSSTSPAPRVSG